MRYIDTHNHITWGVDDGIETIEETRDSLASAANDGIEKIILTPHYIPGKYSIENIKEIDKRMKELQGIALNYNIQVYLGSELFLNQEYLNMVDQKMFHTLANSRYVLVEFDLRKDIGNNTNAEEYLYELGIRKYIPVIAHVERYFHEQLDLVRVQQWIAMGCVIQVNRTSILGLHGTTNKENALQLLKQGLVHIVASDAHRASGSRVCIMSDVYRKIHKLYGVENANLLCCENPERILRDEKLEMMIKRKRRFFSKRGRT